jgi:hypothetical protein
MPYTRYGPFTNGGPPGISAAFLNGLESFLLTINTAATDSQISSDGAGTLMIKAIQATGQTASVNGTISGTATVYQLSTGPFKVSLVSLVNFNNGSAVDLIFPVPYTMMALVWVGNTVGQNISFYQGTSTQIGLRLVHNPGAGATNATVIQLNDWGTVIASFDRIRFQASTSGCTAPILLAGI